MTPGAIELKRLSYLQAMGIESYVSRRQLPGAATSSRLAIVRDRTPALAEAGERAGRGAAGELSPGLPTDSSAAADLSQTTSAIAPGTIPELTPRLPVVETRPRAKNVSPVVSAKPATVVAAEPAFSVVAIAVGGVLWLEELTHPILSREQVQLVQAMASALQLPAGKLDIGQFDWPIHNNSQFDLDAAAANAALIGFVSRRLEQLHCSAMVLLGNACNQRMSADTDTAVRRVHTVSTAQMLDDSQMKRQAWRDLSPLAPGA